MTTTYTTIKDAATYGVEPALGDFADDYDVDAIAREYYDTYDEHDGFSASDPDSFWAIAAKHEISE